MEPDQQAAVRPKDLLLYINQAMFHFNVKAKGAVGVLIHVPVLRLIGSCRKIVGVKSLVRLCRLLVPAGAASQTLCSQGIKGIRV